jgi:hypothetical protein
LRTGTGDLCNGLGDRHFFANFTPLDNGRLMIYFEAAGRKEDGLLKQYFNELRSQGNPFDPNLSSQYSPLS